MKTVMAHASPPCRATASRTSASTGTTRRSASTASLLRRTSVPAIPSARISIRRSPRWHGANRLTPSRWGATGMTSSTSSSRLRTSCGAGTLAYSTRTFRAPTPKPSGRTGSRSTTPTAKTPAHRWPAMHPRRRCTTAAHPTSPTTTPETLPPRLRCSRKPTCGPSMATTIRSTGSVTAPASARTAANVATSCSPTDLLWRGSTARLVPMRSTIRPTRGPIALPTAARMGPRSIRRKCSPPRAVAPRPASPPLPRNRAPTHPLPTWARRPGSPRLGPTATATTLITRRQPRCGRKASTPWGVRFPGDRRREVRYLTPC